jgi:hypothetical protein
LRVEWFKRVLKGLGWVLGVLGSWWSFRDLLKIMADEILINVERN